MLRFNFHLIAMVANALYKILMYIIILKYIITIFSLAFSLKKLQHTSMYAQM